MRATLYLAISAACGASGYHLIFSAQTLLRVQEAQTKDPKDYDQHHNPRRKKVHLLILGKGQKILLAGAVGF